MTEPKTSTTVDPGGPEAERWAEAQHADHATDLDLGRMFATALVTPLVHSIVSGMPPLTGEERAVLSALNALAKTLGRLGFPRPVETAPRPLARGWDLESLAHDLEALDADIRAAYDPTEPASER